MKDLIEEVKASMQSNRQRIMLTGFAIGWGMFILVTLLGSAGGVQKGISSHSPQAKPPYPGTA